MRWRFGAAGVERRGRDARQVGCSKRRPGCRMALPLELSELSETCGILLDSVAGRGRLEVGPRCPGGGTVNRRVKVLVVSLVLILALAPQLLLCWWLAVGVDTLLREVQR